MLRHPLPPHPGYGNTGPRNCATAAVIIVAQSITDLLLNAVVLGLIFAKVERRTRLPWPRILSFFAGAAAAAARPAHSTYLAVQTWHCCMRSLLAS
jgi:hypothetical protein